MVLQFCPVCKALLNINFENGSNIATCRCGFSRKNGLDLTSVDKGARELRGEGVISSQGIVEGIDFVCKKCGYNKAELIDLGERNTNENGVSLYRCLKCGHNER